LFIFRKLSSATRLTAVPQSEHRNLFVLFYFAPSLGFALPVSIGISAMMGLKSSNGLRMAM
jgi:hypothetical protein